MVFYACNKTEKCKSQGPSAERIPVFGMSPHQSGAPTTVEILFCGPASMYEKSLLEGGGTGSHQSGAPTTVEGDPL